jgi:hypothetical protein
LLQRTLRIYERIRAFQGLMLHCTKLGKVLLIAHATGKLQP